jgi:GT2 family glycosyltransferase
LDYAFGYNAFSKKELNIRDEMKKVISVSVIIVNYKTSQLTINCLKSISQNLSGNILISVIVADNDSKDDSAALIEDEIEKSGWNSWVSVLPLEKNGGFADGNNRATEKLFERSHLPDYLWLLNPDTEVKEDACGALAEFLATHREIGIVGSRLEDADGTPQISAFRDHSVISEFLSGMRLGILTKIFSKWIVAPNHSSEMPHRADWVTGASMMVRREVFEDIGLLDEEFFMYFEEVDFCIRARKAGWTCWYLPESRVIHLVGAASGISDTRKKAPRRPAYWFESRRRFFFKNRGRLNLLLADIAWMVGYSTWRIRRMLQGKPDFDPPHFLRDFFQQSVFRKGFRL